MKRTILILLLAPSLLFGCKLFQRDRDKEPAHVTKAGYVIKEIEDNGIFSGGYATVELVSDAMDRQIDEWVTVRTGYGGRSRDELLAIAHRWTYAWHDDYRIFVGEMSPTGYASGFIRMSRAGLYPPIHLAMWDRGGPMRTKDLVPPGSPPWTVREISTGGWTYGYLDVPCPAVGHELDHLIGIGHD